MMAKRFIVILVVSLMVYFISDYFFNDAMLYLLGGAIWGILAEISGSSKDIMGLGYTIVFVLLVCSIVLFFRLRNQSVKYFALFMIAVLLYTFDFILLELVSYDPDIQREVILDSTFKSNAFLIFRVLYKSLFLSLIIYFDGNIKFGKTIADTL